MKIVIGTLPYYPTRDSGKGVDRISYYIFREIQNMQLDYELLGWRNSSESRIVRVLLRLIRYPKFAISKGDVYLATESYSGYLFSLFKKSPTILFVHDLNPFGGFHNAYDSLFSRINRVNTKIRYRRSILSSNIIVVPFEYTKIRLLEIFNIEPNKIKIIPYGIDLPKNFALMNEKGISIGIKRLLFIGGVNPLDRGVDIAIKILSYILKYREDVRLIVSCNRDKWREVKLISSKFMIEKYIEIMDFIPEAQLGEIFLSSDLFLYPSRIGFSLLVLQAMSYGIPVVASNKFDIPEFLREYGQYFEISSPEEMANAILEILNDNKFRSNLVKKGYEICDSHTSTKMALSILELAKDIS